MIKYYFFGMMKYLTNTEHKRFKTHLILIIGLLLTVEIPYFIGLTIANPNMNFHMVQLWFIGLGGMLLFFLFFGSIIWIYIRLYILIKDKLKNESRR